MRSHSFGPARSGARSASATLQAKMVGLPESRKNSRASSLLVVGERRGDGGLAGVEVRDEFFAQRDLGLGRLSPARASFCWRSCALLHRGEVGEDEFGVDHLDVAHGIDAAADVMDVRVLKAAHDLHDGVDFADVAEELVAEPFARARAFHQPRDVHELDRRGHDLLRVREFREHLEPRVRHGDDADVRVDGAKRVVRGLRFARAVTALKSVDLPTLGRPTMPALSIRRGGYGGSTGAAICAL